MGLVVVMVVMVVAGVLGSLMRQLIRQQHATLKKRPKILSD